MLNRIPLQPYAKDVADYVVAHAHIYARSGPGSPSPDENARHIASIKREAEVMAESKTSSAFEDSLANVQKLGIFPKAALVFKFAQMAVAAECVAD